MDSCVGQRVLVLGADERMVLPVVRSLGRRGIVVDVGWCPAESVVFASRYVRSRSEIPLPQGDEAPWASRLMSAIQTQRYDMVIPATEPAVVALRSIRSKLNDVTTLAMTNEEALAVALDKRLTQRLADSLGIATPESVTVESIDDIEEFFATHSVSTIVKPVTSNEKGGWDDKSFVRRFDCVDTARHYIEAQLAAGRRVVLQPVYPGYGVGVEFAAQHGEIITQFQHRRLHETSGNGSTLRESIAVDESMLDAARNLIEALGYHGVGMVEFRYNELDDSWVLLEINPRLWGSLPLAVAAGADFPWYLYQLHSTGSIRQSGVGRIGVRSRQFRADLRWMWRSLTQRFSGDHVASDAIGWTMNHRTIGQWCWDAVRMALCLDHVDTFDASDPLPFVRELTKTSRKVAARPVRGVSQAWSAIKWPLWESSRLSPKSAEGTATQP